MKDSFFKGFKKIKSDDKYTHLRHDDGHYIKVAHDSLKPDMKQALKGLPERNKQSSPKLEQSKVKNFADGGQVEDGQGHYTDANREYYRQAMGNDTESIRNQKLRNEEAKRSKGPIQVPVAFADGGQAQPPAPAPTSPMQESMRKAFKFDEGGQAPGVIDYPSNSIPIGNNDAVVSNELPDPDHTTNIMDAHRKLVDAHSKIVGAMSRGPASQDAPITPDNTSVLPDQQPQMSAPQTVAMPTTPADPSQAPSMVADHAPNMQGDLNQQAIANTSEANRADTASAQNVSQQMGANADIYGQQSNSLNELHRKYENIGNDLHAKYEDLSDQIEKGHIDPHHWWDSKTTGGKVLTAIGMMFAGAGLGASGHPELANKAIDEAINRDIDSQKQDLSNKNTLLGKYMDMYNNLPMAENAARLTLNASVEGLINQQAAKAGGANAVNAATMANAARRQQLLPQMEGLAKGQAMMGMYKDLGGSGGQMGQGDNENQYKQQMQRMQVLAPERFKEMESRYLPGVGVASKAVPEKVAEEMTNRKDLSDKLAQLENFARDHHGTILDRKVVAQGHALANAVQDAYRRGNAQGVFKESEKNFVEGIIGSDPTSFATWKTIPGYRQARQLNDDTVKQYQKAYGVKPFGQASQDQSSSQTATMGGIKYVKVPGGWKKAE